MIKGLYSAAQNLYAKMKNIEIVSNNLANINSTGFKRELPFSEIISRFDSPNIKQITDFSNGAFTQTTNPFDLAISGKGFFTIKKETGTELTKNGKFSISDDGFLTDQNGNRVQGKKGDINILDSILDKNEKVVITKSGEIKAGEKIIDELLISSPDDELSLVRTDGLSFTNTDELYTTAENELFEVHQGYLEESNVNPIIELQSMIELNSNFETTRKMINSMDDSLGRTNEVGRV